MDGGVDRTRVVIVGGGFAGVACARKLAARRRTSTVTLVDRNDYHQFQPLLYQVATSMLAPRDIAYPLRKDRGRVRRLRRQARRRGQHRSAGADRDHGHRRDLRRRLPRPGGRLAAELLRDAREREHAFPLYSLDDAERLRRGSSRRSRKPTATPARRIDEGAIDFVVVGGGPTGVEVAGALSEMINTTMVARVPGARAAGEGPPRRSRPCPARDVRRQGARLRGAGSSSKDGVELLMGTGVTEIGPGHVTLSDGSTIRTRCVIWGGGLHGRTDRRRHRPAAGSRRPDRRRSGLHRRRASRACSSSATSPTSRPGTARPIPQLGLRRPAERRVGGEDDPRRRQRREAASRSTTSTRGRWR